MTPTDLLEHHDSGALWPHAMSMQPGFDVAAAYAQSLAVRQLRMARGEVPRGYKVGFTNRTIWPRYNVFAPIWGTVWDSTLSFCDGTGEVSLTGSCQPRLEPEIVFGMKARPAPGATLDQLFDAIEWVAPGFEVVQSHLPDWKFLAPDTVADGGLHARLLVGLRTPLKMLAADAGQLDALLAGAQAHLHKGDREVALGQGLNVLGSPLRALHHFVNTLRACPGAPDLAAGDVVTTGTWTDAWPVAPGEQWSVAFTLPDMALAISFTD
jgi:2-keto-4-pentenoate hydratase